MQHIDELTLMMYIDRELRSEENLQVSSHLLDCPSCQATLARLQAEQSFFCHSFCQSISSFPINLTQTTAKQIEMIASIHKAKCLQSSRRCFLLVCTAAILFVIGTIYCQGWTIRWMQSFWGAWQHSVLWNSTFWLRDNASSLFSVSTIYSLSGICVVTISILLFTYLFRTTQSHWSNSEGVMKE